MNSIKPFFPAMLLFFAFSTLMSCSKDEEGETLVTLSESEAVEIIAPTLERNSGGLTTSLTDLTEEVLATATSTEGICDSAYSNVIEKDYQGVNMTASYTADVSYEMTCNLFDVPESAAFSSNTAASYTTARIQSDDNATFVAEVSGLQPVAADLLIAGEYSRNGTQELSFMEQRNVTSTFTTSLSAIAINKQSREIESGSGTFSLTGTTQSSSFSFTGSIVFNGDRTATLTINGTDYIIDLN